MTESQKKLWVVVAGIVLFGGIAAYRTTVALREARAPRIDWEAQLRVFPEAKSLPGFHRAIGPRVYVAEPVTPHLRLATMRMGSRLAANYAIQREVVDGKHQVQWPAFVAATRMGANALAFEGVDDSAKGPLPDWSELILGVYLLHAGKVPAALVKQPDQEFCQVATIHPDSVAQRDDLRPGDLLLEVDGSTPPPIRGEGLCAWLATRLHREPFGTLAHLKVLRDAAFTELDVHTAPTVGFDYEEVPVLPSEVIGQ